MMAYFAEEGFADWMRQEVEPYLRQHGEQGCFLGSGGAVIHYHRYRLENAEKCVVISHGFCEFAEKYNEMIYYLMHAGYSVYIPEHRGHGYSDRSTPDTEMVHVEAFEDYVRDFVTFVKTVVVPREKERYLLGHSMGGAIAILTLEQYPTLFRAAVLSSPMCGMKTGRFSNRLADLVAWMCCRLGKGKSYAIGQSGFREMPDFVGSSCVSEARYQYIFQKRLECPQYRTYGGSYAWVHAGIKAGRQLMKKKNLEKINIPILLFMAGNEHMVDNVKIEEFAKHTKQTQLVMMQNAKHEIFNADRGSRRIYYEKIFAFLRKAHDVGDTNNTADTKNRRDE